MTILKQNGPAIYLGLERAEVLPDANSGRVTFIKHAIVQNATDGITLTKQNPLTPDPYCGIYSSGNSEVSISEEGVEQCRKLRGYFRARAEIVKGILSCPSTAKRALETQLYSLLPSNEKDPLFSIVIPLSSSAFLTEKLIHPAIVGKTGTRLKSPDDWLYWDRKISNADTELLPDASGLPYIAHESHKLFRLVRLAGYCIAISNAINKLYDLSLVTSLTDLNKYDFAVFTHAATMFEILTELNHERASSRMQSIQYCQPFYYTWIEAIQKMYEFIRENPLLKQLFHIDPIPLEISEDIDRPLDRTQLSKETKISIGKKRFNTIIQELCLDPQIWSAPDSVELSDLYESLGGNYATPNTLPITQAVARIKTDLGDQIDLQFWLEELMILFPWLHKIRLMSDPSRKLEVLSALESSVTAKAKQKGLSHEDIEFYIGWIRKSYHE